MKNSIAFLSLLLFLSFGCNKADNIATRATQSTDATGNNTDAVGIVDRDGTCCCTIIVSSTYFEGIRICGVTGEGSDCNFCSDCGNSCGVSRLFPLAKNDVFCTNGCPFKVTNVGFLPIRVSFVCAGGTSSAIWIDPNASAIYTNDCSTPPTLCNETRCGG
jgi:hypothetical protein